MHFRRSALALIAIATTVGIGLPTTAHASGGGTTAPACATSALIQAPYVSGSGDRAFIQFGGHTHNCTTTTTESVTLQFTELQSTNPACTLPSFGYGLSQPIPAGGTEDWYPKSGSLKCFGTTYDEEVTTWVNGSETDLMIFKITV